MPYVTLDWLGEHVQIAEGTDVARLASDLVKVGIEEEQIHPSQVQGPLVVGKVLTQEPKEQKNGKVINYCRVDVGKYNDAPGEGKEPSELPSRGIICGAHNFGPGDLVAVVLPGAVLPGPFPISSRKTYGHFSDGMICSERELGLSGEHQGILVLTEKYASEQIPAPGESLMELFGFGEEILEVNVTPDRGYCFSMRGLAREYSHSTGHPFTDPGLAEVKAADGKGFPVDICDEAPIRGNVGCDRFVTRVVRGVDPQAKTPGWMAHRLEVAGMRSISLPVDITNYVMLDLGQPMHAYDLSKVRGPLVVRRARSGESLKTLDEVDRALDEQDLLICDSDSANRVLAIAGVMGGADTEVDGETTEVLFEAAHFDPVSVARSSRRHKIPSEAAKRFERGVDPQLPAVAAQRAVELLVEYGSGVADAHATDLNEVPEPRRIAMAEDYPCRLTGVDYSRERICELLRRIGAKVQEQSDSFVVTAPSWRPDLTGPADLVEEIARLDGYDKIDSVVPAAPAGTGYSFAQRVKRDVQAGLAQAGLTQVLSYPFIGNAHDRQHLSEDDPARKCVKLANPLAGDHPYLRTSILDTLLPVAELNVARGIDSLAIFECGKVYHPQGTVPAALPSADSRPDEQTIAALQRGVPAQPDHLGVVFAGAAQPISVLGKSREFDWADAIEVARSIGRTVGVSVAVESASGDTGPFHPGRVGLLKVEDKVFGRAGELHPRVVKEYHLPARSAACEIDLSKLLDSAGRAAKQVLPVSTFPPSKEDLALVVDEAVPAGSVEALIRSSLGEVCEDVRLFDVYRGEGIGSGKKSLAFSLKMRAPDRTLTAEETAGLRKRVVKKAGRKFGAKLRS